MFDIRKKSKLKSGIQEREFSCIRDDLTIRGTEYRPQGENLPIAIICHGFMACQDSVRHYAMFMAEQGYASYCFDFCGGSVMKNKSDGKTTDMSVLTEVWDLEAVITYIRTLPYVQEDEIFLMGCSQGGLVSALTAAKNQYPIEKLCLFYPAFCIPDDARAGQLLKAKFNPDNVPETMYCGPMKLGKCYAMDVMDMDPYEATKSYNGKVPFEQYMHGEEIHIVSVKEKVLRYFAWIPAAALRKESAANDLASVVLLQAVLLADTAAIHANSSSDSGCSGCGD